MKTNKSLLTQSLQRRAKAAARKEGLTLSAFAADAVRNAIYSQRAVQLHREEIRRLNMLAVKMRATPIKTMYAILRNALGFDFKHGSHQYRVIELSNVLADELRVS